MNRNFYNIALAVIFSVLAGSGMAQERYLQEVFTGVEVTADVPFALNISVLTGTPAPVELFCDVYQPAGDTETERPLILVAHTGSFLPPLFNGGTTGARSDSVVVETCKRLARQGFVAAAYTYRLGWLPESDDQNIRTGTLLQAAYRGVQDTRSAVRFFRKTVAEDGNPYGIDPEKIGIWGIGTGGYLSAGAATLDRWEEVTLEKFINSVTFQPFVDSTLLGNLYGTTEKPLCLPNHVEYSDDIAIALNMGGAIGDTAWLEGNIVPPMLGYHCLRDPFAPFNYGPVIVPTTGDFVVFVSGTRQMVEISNNYGYNDVLKDIPASVDPIQQIVEIFKTVDVTLPGDVTIKLGTDNMYPFITEGFESGPWDWWSKPQLDIIVSLTNQALGTDFNADTLHNNGLLTNPGMSKEKASAYLDTIFLYSSPRICAALDLGCGFTSSVEELDPSEVGFSFGPNPASDRIEIRTDAEFPIEHVSMYDLNGRLVLKHIDVNESRFGFQVGHLTPGMYLMKTEFEKGILNEKILIH